MTPNTHPTGQDLKTAGQALALFNEPASWVDRFLDIAREYLASLPDGALFALEDVRAHCEAQGLPAPHTHYVWGSLPQRMLRDGLPMESSGQYRKALSPETRAHPVALWTKKGGAHA